MEMDTVSTEKPSKDIESHGLKSLDYSYAMQMGELVHYLRHKTVRQSSLVVNVLGYEAQEAKFMELCNFHISIV